MSIMMYCQFSTKMDSSTNSVVGGNPKIVASMLVLFSQLAFGRDNVTLLVQCDIIPMLCQALEKFPGELPIIRAALKVPKYCSG
jgi:hypothetical protein